jgi:hypothetical protein
VLQAMNQSYHELVVCGNVTTSFSRTLLFGAFNPPSSLRWDGNRLIASGDGMQMTLEVLADGRVVAGADAAAAVVMARASLALKADVIVKDEKDGAVIAYHMASPAVPVQELADEKRLPWEYVDASASRGEQQVAVTHWDVAYLDGALDGRIEVAVSGGEAPYNASFAYAKSAYADVTLGCSP